MKTKKKDFDTVKTFRDIKHKLYVDIKGMNFEQFSDYLQKTKIKPASKL